MKNPKNTYKSAELDLLDMPYLSAGAGGDDVLAESGRWWQRCQQAVSAWLERAERRVTEGFRVPPGGG